MFCKILDLKLFKVCLSVCLYYRCVKFAHMYVPCSNAHHIAHRKKLVQASVIVMQAPAAQSYLTTTSVADQLSSTKTHVYKWQCESGPLKRNASQVHPRV